MDARTLARKLKPYEIKPGTIRLADGTTPKGYRRDWFFDAWARYLTLSPQEPPQAPQAPQPPHDTPHSNGVVADVADVADISGTGNGHVPLATAEEGSVYARVMALIPDTDSADGLDDLGPERQENDRLADAHHAEPCPCDRPLPAPDPADGELRCTRCGHETGGWVS